MMIAFSISYTLYYATYSSNIMETFLVGGAVRDSLLGRESLDRDFVVVGTTIAAMLDSGFKLIGKDFPVFLHPDTGDEYAMARRERKVTSGYRGFEVDSSPEVTLTDDLSRRDLTMNAIAKSSDGRLFDPFNGQEDIKNKVFRHVSPAFAEDPVRILRVARFAARHPDFTVAPETNELMQTIVKNGEIDALVPERVWKEISRGLMESKPSRMLAVLRDCGALARLLPELDILWGIPQPANWHPEIDTGVHIMQVIDYAAERGYSLPVRFAAMTHDLGKGVTPPAAWPSHHGHEELGVPLVDKLCSRLKVPSDCASLARITANNHGRVGTSLQLTPKKVLELLYSCDAFRRPERLQQMLEATQCDARGRNSETVFMRDKPFPQMEFLQLMFTAASGVNAGDIAKKCQDAGVQNLIPDKIHEARMFAVRNAMKIPRENNIEIVPQKKMRP